MFKPFTWLFWCGAFGSGVATFATSFQSGTTSLVLMLCAATMGECLMVMSIFYLDGM